LAFVLVNPITKTGDVKTKAEVLVTLEWGEGDFDIDLWCEDPVGNTAWFNNKDTGLMHLDRDDLGDVNDIIYVDGKQEVLALNQEILSIRKLTPGEYICNIHYYRSPRWRNKYESKENISVVLKVEKLNPIYKLVYTTKRVLTTPGEEITAIRFTIEPSGKVDNLQTTFKSLIKGKYHRGSEE